MKCEHAQEFFSEYVEQSLDKPQTVALEAHLTACASCRHGLEGLHQTWQALKMVPAVEPPKDLAWRVLAQLQRERAERLEAERRRVHPLLGWLHSLTPGAAFGYAVLAALLLIAAAFPLTGLSGRISTTFGWGGSRVLPSATPPLVNILGAYQDTADGRWYHRLVLTAPDISGESHVSVDPLVSLNGRLVRTKEESVRTATASQSLMIPVPATVPEGHVEAVSVRVDEPGRAPYSREFSVPASGQ
jgi:hypothetical protein